MTVDPGVDPRFAGSTILIVGAHYAPETSGNAPYTTNMARHLCDLGADVMVLTGVPHYPSWTVPEPYRTGRVFREWDGQVRLIRCRHFVPRSMTVSSRLLYEGTFLLNALTEARSLRPDVVLAVTPLLADVAVAAAIARDGVPLGVLIQDLTGAGARRSGIEGGASVASVVSAAELAVIRRADRVAVVSQGFRESLEASGIRPDRITFLPNYAQAHIQPGDRTAARARLGWDQHAFLAVHTGNIGYKQDLVRLVEAARYLPPESRIRIVIVGDGSLRRDVKDAAGGKTNVEVLPPVPQEQYADVLAAADVLILHEREGVAEMSMPSKLTSYLAAGKPIVAVTSDRGTTSDFLRATGAAVVVEPGCPRATAVAMQTLARSESTRHGMARSAAEFAAAHLTEEAGLRSTRRFVEDLLGVSTA